MTTAANSAFSTFAAAPAAAFTPTFTPEPYLPWLRTDPATQQPAAFIDASVFTLNHYLPMSRFFPAGTKVVMKRIRAVEDLTEGVYLLEQLRRRGPGISEEYTDWRFGRFAGLDTCSSERARARDHKKGFVHFELSTDVAVKQPYDYSLRPDGTCSVHMNFNNPDFTLWQFTHYVSLPADALTGAGLSEDLTGCTAQQDRWMREEAAIEEGKAEEYRVQVLGGFPEPECRVVLHGQLRQDFNTIATHVRRMSASAAKKYKKGAVALTWRECREGLRLNETFYMRLADAQELVDLLRAEAALQRGRDAVVAKAANIRAGIDELLAECYHLEAAQEPVAEPRATA